MTYIKGFNGNQAGLIPEAIDLLYLENKIHSGYIVNC
jgi:hypothetical protein